MLSTMKARIAAVLAVDGDPRRRSAAGRDGGTAAISTITASPSTTAGTTTPTTTVARAMAMAASSASGGFEPPPSAPGVLVLADPPEAGWRMRQLEQGACDRVRSARPFDHEPGCDRDRGGRAA